MKVTLQEILPQAAGSSYAIAGFNVFSIEWARAVIRAAERVKSPVIIMTNKSMVAHLPPQFSGPIFSDMAARASVPVCVHLDHNTDYDIIETAIDSGFSSIMYDGSQLSLEDNILNTNKVRKMAQKKGLSVEAEVGTVRYIDMPDTNTKYTSVEDAKKFSDATDVHALAISVGTTHRMIHRESGEDNLVQYKRIEEIERVVDLPLVIHGASGVPVKDLQKMKQHRIAKFNIGTLLRQKFAYEIRKILSEDEEIFDLYDMTKNAYFVIEEEALSMIKVLQ